ncbi:hypothetical protein C8F04DRAFT_1098243 [Mycena alexandri]|uniref:Nephrocystin 3-like N-terminal domain-containing protein n=1 Tax=Mycena alexandri TaxID=1745969 RepID=A0AAD6X1G4_9AGAR|nr:hypothetical protein C8F04DRAFT_1098243 [Mycena alexandri]
MPSNTNSVLDGTFNSNSGDSSNEPGNLTQASNSQSIYWSAPPALYGPAGHLPLTLPNTSTDDQSTIGPIRHQRMGQHAQHTPYGRGQRTIGYAVGNGNPEDAATLSSVSGMTTPYEHIPGYHGNISAYNIPPSGDYGVHDTGEGFPTTATYNNIAGNMIQLHTTSHGESGLDILYRHIAMGAVYDSGEQLPEPACHHGTRVAVLESLAAWSTDERPESTLLWLHGPAGMGKSAVAQAFAAGCRLGASFFFRRGNPERGSWHRLFTTIAYRIAHSIPELCVPIQRAVETNKLVVNQLMKYQFQRLIIEPFQQAQIVGMVPILVLDGLDECEDERIQQDILRLLIDAVRAHQLPMRILLTSRPEPHIRNILESQANFDMCRGLELSPDESAYADIRKYLRDEFSRIRLEAWARGESLGQVWPTPDVLEVLVKKSSAIFVYAATVIRFVGDQYRDPQEQLQSVLDLDPDSTAPLDDLYTQILSMFSQQKGRGEESVTELARRNQQLRILHTIWRVGYLINPEEIDALLDLPPNTSRRNLGRLHSLVHVPPICRPFGLHRRVKLLHASFADYLGDPRRSKGWCVSLPWLESDNLFCMIRLLSSPPLTNDARAFYCELVEAVPQALSNATLSDELVAALRNEIFQDSLFLKCDQNPLWPKRDSLYPMDLVEVWEGHQFLANFVEHLKLSRDKSSPTFKFDSLYREILSSHPELMFILTAMLLWPGFASHYDILRVRGLTHGAFKPFIHFRGQLELPFPEGDSPLDFVADPNRVLGLGLDLGAVANDLVLQWIHRTRKLLLNGDWWVHPAILTVLAECREPSPEIIAELATLDLSQICGRLMSDPRTHHELHRYIELKDLQVIVNWLQARSTPPLEVIAFWEQQITDMRQCDFESGMRDSDSESD